MVLRAGSVHSGIFRPGFIGRPPLGLCHCGGENEWLTRQVIQAFFLTIIVSVINAVLDLLNIFGNVPIVGTAIGVVFNVISTIVSIVVLVFVIIAMVKVVKGQEANMPLLSKLANRAYGIIEKKVYTQAAPANYAQPQAPQAPQVPVQPQAPQAPQAPVQPQNPQNPTQHQ